jgi:hypothetical protein
MKPVHMIFIIFLGIVVIFGIVILVNVSMKTGPGVDPYMKEARSIAEKSSVCTSVGGIGVMEVYNNNSNTYWFALAAKKEGCSPACVVFMDNKSAEVNWRCTGLITP